MMKCIRLLSCVGLSLYLRYRIVLVSVLGHSVCLGLEGYYLDLGLDT